MQLTVLQLRNQARFKADITNTTTITNAEILTQLNEGYSKLVRAVVESDQDFLETQKSKFNLALNTAVYSLPANCIKYKQCRLAYTTPSTENDYRIATAYDPSQAAWVSTDEGSVPVSNPQVDITNTSIRIFPVPTVAVTNGGEHYYIARPSALSATGDVMSIPADYHDLAAVYAASKICEKLENYGKADRLMNEFNASKELMKQEIAGREMNKSARFKSSHELPNTFNRREL